MLDTSYYETIDFLIKCKGDKKKIILETGTYGLRIFANFQIDYPIKLKKKKIKKFNLKKKNFLNCRDYLIICNPDLDEGKYIVEETGWSITSYLLIYNG